ncbi:zinc-dependent peptidase [Seonamhaeicola marinus]|nr:zinc-dependent peptidase [Seonamhaeicola marinus]
MAYVVKRKKPFYIHFHLFKKTLNERQKSILRNQFTFYNRLSERHKRLFDHRVASFIKDKDFIGRQGIEVSDEMEVLISATAVMLTFGFRDFYIGLVSRIVIYPKAFYSNLNNEYHKGEFNPKMKTLVLSWEDFKEGYDISNDNLNLGIHEFTHAIHLNSKKEGDVSSIIFSTSFKELSLLLSQNEELRQELIASNYFRAYAYTNQSEFLAVIIETFIETPKQFKSEFPSIYVLVKQMLNFQIPGY